MRLEFCHAKPKFPNIVSTCVATCPNPCGDTSGATHGGIKVCAGIVCASPLLVMIIGNITMISEEASKLTRLEGIDNCVEEGITGCTFEGIVAIFMRKQGMPGSATSGTAGIMPFTILGLRIMFF